MQELQEDQESLVDQWVAETHHLYSHKLLIYMTQKHLCLLWLFSLCTYKPDRVQQESLGYSLGSEDSLGSRSYSTFGICKSFYMNCKKWHMFLQGSSGERGEPGPSGPVGPRVGYSVDLISSNTLKDIFKWITCIFYFLFKWSFRGYVLCVRECVVCMQGIPGLGGEKGHVGLPGQKVQKHLIFIRKKSQISLTKLTVHKSKHGDFTGNFWNLWKPRTYRNTRTEGNVDLPWRNTSVGRSFLLLNNIWFKYACLFLGNAGCSRT